MPDMLQRIKLDMAFMGWKGDPDRGFSHKEDVNGNVIARHHDATWVADTEEAAARCERLAALEELNRRYGGAP